MVAVGVRVLVVCVGVLALGWHSDARLVLRGRRQVAEASCSVVSERSATIIQTKQSLAAGAEFLVAPDVSDQDDCLSACCNTPSCNTAIVKHKDDKYGCYLFNCGSPAVCSFTSHTGYSAFHMVTEIIDTHASDLANLVSVRSPTQPTTTATVPATVTDHLVTEPSSLYGACRTSDNCALQQHLECLRGYCVCQPGYHTVASVCRADCHRFQFECVNKDDPSLSECIAVYDRCNAIIQCRDGSDEMDCTTDSTDTDHDELVSGLTRKQSRPTDVNAQNSERVIQPNIMSSESAASSGLGRFSNASQSMGVTGIDGSHGSMSISRGNSVAVSDEMNDAEQHLQQVSDSLGALDSQTGNRQLPAETAASYHHRDASLSSGAEPGKSVGRLSEAGHQDQGQMKTADAKATQSLRKQAANEKDVVSERGHLLLSSMVDDTDNSQSRYPAAVESGPRQGPAVVSPSGINSRKVQPHRKPIFGSVDQSAAGSAQSLSLDQSQHQPPPQQQVDTSSRYQPGTEPRRLRKPDLSRVDHPGPSDLGRFDARPADSRWQKPASSYQYGSSSSGKYSDYVKPGTRQNSVESELPSSGKLLSPSSPAGHDSRLVKNYGQMSDSSGSGRDGGGPPGRIPVRAGLTEARQRNPEEGKNRGDKDLDSGRGFLSKRPPPPPSSSQYEGSSQFRSPHDGESSYSRGGGAKPQAASYEGSRHTGLVADESRYPSNSQYPGSRRYPSNSRDFLYGEPFYPVSDDYYYADGPAGHAPGYDPQAAVNYDYYNMDTGAERKSSPVKTVEHPRNGQTASVTVSSASLKPTIVKPAVAVMGAGAERQPVDDIVNTTSHTLAVSSSSTVAATRLSPSTTQQPASTSSRPRKPPPPRAGRKHHQYTVSAAVAHSRLLWSTAGVQGAIVALTLGIIVTVLTLAYIACHYRHQRRLSRRHRHLPTGSNDADYLVNGMYL